jgi:hypothetical protein
MLPRSLVAAVSSSIVEVNSGRRRDRGGVSHRCSGVGVVRLSAEDDER